MADSEHPLELNKKSDIELHDMLMTLERGSAEYNAVIRETMSRVARLEEIMEEKEEPVLKREFYAMGIAAATIVVIIFYVIYSYG